MDEQPTFKELLQEINAMMLFDGGQPINYMQGNHDIRAHEEAWIEHLLEDHPKVALREGNVVWVEFR
jgi:hypothetical protein